MFALNIDRPTSIAHSEAETDNQKAGAQHEEDAIWYDMSMAQESKTMSHSPIKSNFSVKFFHDACLACPSVTSRNDTESSKNAKRHTGKFM